MRYYRHTEQGLSHQIQSRQCKLSYCLWFYILSHGQEVVYYKNFESQKTHQESTYYIYLQGENNFLSTFLSSTCTQVAKSTFVFWLIMKEHEIWVWNNGHREYFSWFKVTIFCFTISFYKWDDSHKCYINTLHFVNKEIFCKYLQPGSIPVISFSLCSSPFNPLKSSFTLIA